MRLIDADAIPWTDLNADMPNTKIKVLVTFADKVNRMPTIEERKKGKWIKYEDRGCWHCSECGTDNYYAYVWNCDTGLHEFQDSFCPHCGADMRGDGHETD